MIEKLKEILQESHHIVFFGGAGCSCETQAYTHLKLDSHLSNFYRISIGH